MSSLLNSNVRHEVRTLRTLTLLRSISMSIYSPYTGYVYLWYDTRAKLFYLGGHHGKVEDSYICSNDMMKRAYNKRPETFRFRVLEYVYDGTKSLREAEQKWLDKIQDHELYWTPNIYNKTVKYYNKKKHSAGGNGSANKGKSHTPWNKGLKGVQVQTDEKRRKCSEKMKETWAKRKAAVYSVSKETAKTQ